VREGAALGVGSGDVEGSGVATLAAGSSTAEAPEGCPGIVPCVAVGVGVAATLEGAAWGVSRVLVAK
jgi:hypothetical protein